MTLWRRLNFRFLNFLLLSALVFPAAPGCSFKHLAVTGTAEVLEDGVTSFEAESDVTLAREAAASQIKLLEALHNADPKNENVLLVLARTFGSYAFGFLEREAETDPAVRARAAALYDRGAAYGMKLLELRLGRGTTADAKNGAFDDWQKRLARAGIRDVPALFWTAYDWAGAIRKSASSPEAVAELPRAVALMERVLALQPSYYYGSAHLFMGVYYAERPRMAGGNPQKAREEFAKGIQASGGKFMMGQYLWARFGAVQTQDVQRFDALLNTVIDSPPDLLPEQRLSQEIARNWARELKKEKTKYFAEE